MKNKIRRVALSTLLVMALIIVAIPTTARADIDSETLVGTPYTGIVNGIERKLIMTETKSNILKVYFQIGEEEPELVYVDILNSGVDQYGTVWIIDPLEKSISGWNYDLSPNDRWFDTIPDPNDPRGYVHDADSFVFEGTGSKAVLVGYKTASGEIKPLLTFEELKAIVEPDSSVPEPSYVPKETPMPDTQPVETPSVSASAPPTQEPDTSEAPTSTAQAPSVSSLPTSAPSNSSVTNPPSATVQPTVTPKVSKKLSIKTSKKKGKTTYSLCEGNKMVIEYTLKKGKLDWKVGKKKGNAKGVKYVMFIKKSKNIIFLDKKGRVYTVSSKTGKKKLIIEKGGKKFVPSSKFKFAANVKTVSKKTIDVKNN